MKPRKVFCLGFQKTGTSSLGKALGKLGYSVAGYYPFRDFAEKSDVTWEEITIRACEIAKEYDAAQDTPWPLLYRELDTAFPNSRFVHITRDSDAWINSAVKDFGRHPNAIHNLIYGCAYPGGNEKTWIDRYSRHNAEVKEYFTDRPDDFISLDLNKGEVNWENLCRFLGEPDPGIPWPHANPHGLKQRRQKYYKIMKMLGLRS